MCILWDTIGPELLLVQALLASSEEWLQLLSNNMGPLFMPPRLYGTEYCMNPGISDLFCKQKFKKSWLSEL